MTLRSTRSYWEHQAGWVERIIARMRKPITYADTATLPATARDEVEAILAAVGPLTLDEIVVQNEHDHAMRLARLWGKERLREGLTGLSADHAVRIFGWTRHTFAIIWTLA